jgi:hypothetical protein
MLYGFDGVLDTYGLHTGCEWGSDHLKLLLKLAGWRRFLQGTVDLYLTPLDFLPDVEGKRCPFALGGTFPRLRGAVYTMCLDVYRSRFIIWFRVRFWRFSFGCFGISSSIPFNLFSSRSFLN